jgi:hypothetical protein
MNTAHENLSSYTPQMQYFTKFAVKSNKSWI